MKIFCISVRTGFEEKISDIVHLLKTKMRLKTGKEYFEQFFSVTFFLKLTKPIPQSSDFSKRQIFFAFSLQIAIFTHWKTKICRL